MRQEAEVRAKRSTDHCISCHGSTLHGKDYQFLSSRSYRQNKNDGVLTKACRTFEAMARLHLLKQQRNRRRIATMSTRAAKELGTTANSMLMLAIAVLLTATAAAAAAAAAAAPPRPPPACLHMLLPRPATAKNKHTSESWVLLPSTCIKNALNLALSHLRGSLYKQVDS